MTAFIPATAAAEAALQAHRVTVPTATYATMVLSFPRTIPAIRQQAAILLTEHPVPKAAATSTAPAVPRAITQTVSAVPAVIPAPLHATNVPVRGPVPMPMAPMAGSTPTRSLPACK